MRILCGLASGFFALMYVIITLTSLFTGKFAYSPTPVSIEHAEADAFPDSNYLSITDGYIVFSLGEVNHRGSTAEGNLPKRFVAPVVSEALLQEWEDSMERGEKVDATRARLLVSIDAEIVAERWPHLYEQAVADLPLDLAPVQMDITGDTKLATHMVFKPRKLDDRTRNFDWQEARSLRHGLHFFGIGRLGMNSAIILVFSFVAFLLISSSLSGSTQTLEVGESQTYGPGDDESFGEKFDPLSDERERRLQRELAEIEAQLTDEELQQLDEEMALEEAEEAAAHASSCEHDQDSIPENSCEIEFIPAGPGEIKVQIRLLGNLLEAQEANLELYIDARVLDKPSPVHARKAIYKREIVLSKKMDPVPISLRELGVYIYRGQHLETRLEARVSVDGQTLVEGRVELDSLRLEALNPTFTSEIPESRLLPKDSYSPRFNFGVLPTLSQAGVLVSCILTISAVSIAAVTIHADWDSGFRYDALIGGLIAALFGGLFIRLGLTSYARLTMNPISDLVREQGEIRLGDLFTGKSSIDIDGARLRIVAWNIESGEEVVGSVKARRQDVFEEETRKMIVFEKQIEHIAKGRAIESYCDETISLQQLCASHCPPVLITDNHGIAFGIEIQLVHPDLLDISSNTIIEGLIFTGGAPHLFFEDFLPAKSLK